jgi:hypothetical protein
LVVVVVVVDTAALQACWFRQCRLGTWRYLSASLALAALLWQQTTPTAMQAAFPAGVLLSISAQGLPSLAGLATLPLLVVLALQEIRQARQAVDNCGVPLDQVLR